MVKPDTATMIRKLRLALGLTQEQFAAKVGVTFSTANRWESGKSKPSPLAMQQIKELSAEPNHRTRKPSKRRETR